MRNWWKRQEKEALGILAFVAIIILVIVLAWPFLQRYWANTAQRRVIESAIRSETPALYVAVDQCGEQSASAHGLGRGIARVSFDDIAFIDCLQARGYEVESK